MCATENWGTNQQSIIKNHGYILDKTTGVKNSAGDDKLTGITLGFWMVNVDWVLFVFLIYMYVCALVLFYIRIDHLLENVFELGIVDSTRILF